MVWCIANSDQQKKKTPRTTSLLSRARQRVTPLTPTIPLFLRESPPPPPAAPTHSGPVRGLSCPSLCRRSLFPTKSSSPSSSASQPAPLDRHRLHPLPSPTRAANAADPPAPRASNPTPSLPTFPPPGARPWRRSRWFPKAAAAGGTRTRSGGGGRRKVRGSRRTPWWTCTRRRRTGTWSGSAASSSRADPPPPRSGSPTATATTRSSGPRSTTTRTSRSTSSRSASVSASPAAILLPIRRLRIWVYPFQRLLLAL